MKKTLLNNSYWLKLPAFRQDTWSREWERERLKSLYKNINKGDLVCYVGAEHGDIPALLGTWGAQLILVEPAEAAWPNIKLMFDINQLPPPLLSFVGFAANLTEINEAQYIPIGGWPLATIGEPVAEVGFRHLNEGNAPKEKLDNILADFQPDIITMDVEGAELEVLKGAEKTIQKYRPLLYISVHPEFMYDRYNQYANDLFGYLYGLGYKYKVLDYDHEWHVVYYHPQGRALL